MNITKILPKLKNLSYADKLKAMKFLATEINREQTNRNQIEQSDIVVLNLADYQKMREELEELDEIRAYDKAIATDDEVIPFEQAIAEIENNC